MISVIMFFIYMYFINTSYGDFSLVPINHVIMLIFIGSCGLIQYAVDRIVKAIKESK